MNTEKTVMMPALRVNFHREKILDVPGSVIMRTMSYTLGPMKATYAIRIPCWLASFFQRRELRRIARLEDLEEQLVAGHLQQSR